MNGCVTAGFVGIRLASPSDIPAIIALMEPEIAAGTLLPRVVRAGDFLVADGHGALLGVVALAPWSEEVAELGSLVAGPRGQGLGAALVEAAMTEAAARGYTTVVALTGIAGFFERRGFSSVAAAPWARARGCATLPAPARLDQAIGYKARVCAACPRLEGCAQSLLCRSTASAARAVA